MTRLCLPLKIRLMPSVILILHYFFRRSLCILHYFLEVSGMGYRITWVIHHRELNPSQYFNTNSTPKNCSLDFELNTRCLCYNHISELYLASGNAWISNLICSRLHNAQHNSVQIVPSSPQTPSAGRAHKPHWVYFQTHEGWNVPWKTRKNGPHSWVWDHSLPLPTPFSLIFSTFALISWSNTLSKPKSKQWVSVSAPALREIPSGHTHQAQGS